MSEKIDNGMQPVSKTVAFKGLNSGDCECFCWEVDRETFMRVARKAPDKFDRVRGPDELFRLYPGHIFGHEFVEMEIVITWSRGKDK